MKPYYEQSGVTIYHGDCREILPTLEKVDHVITDPPYDRDIYMRAKTTADRRKGAGSLRNAQPRGVTLEKFAVGAIGHIDDALMAAVAGEARRIVRRWTLVFSDAESAHRWRFAIEAAGLRYVRTGAWAKPNAMPQMSGDRPAQGFEPCTIAHAAGRTRWNGGGRPALWTYYVAGGNERPDHPCPKPEPLMVELVALFTDAGETILDPFMGSGTTLVAAKRLGRKAIGIEREEKYCEIAVKRLRQEALPLEVA